MKVNLKFLFKMVFTGMKKNIKALIPFLTSSALMIAVYYIMDTLTRGGLQDANGNFLFYGGNYIALFLSIGKAIVLLFSVVFILYANRFLMRSRKKEMGLYGILGMSKKNIAAILFVESIINAFISIGGGILLGTFFNKIMLLLLYKVVGQDPTEGFVFSSGAFVFTNIFFVIVFIICFVINTISINLGKPTDLLKSENLGEKEPKNKYITLIIGTVCLASGYFLALSTKNTFSAITVLFISILLVAVGTYFLFVAGSIFILKVLKNNKKFYYSTKNFISVSNLMFRMKHNAVGLASICILSTAVIILITCSSSLSLLGEYNINKMCPNDVSITVQKDDEHEMEDYLKIVDESCKELGIEREDFVYNQVRILACFRSGDDFVAEKDSSVADFAHLADTYVLTTKEYKMITGEDVTLSENEILIKGCTAKALALGKVNILGNEYTIKGTVDSKKAEKIYDASMALFTKLVLVVNEKTAERFNSTSKYGSNHYVTIGFDLKEGASKDNVNALGEVIKSKGLVVNGLEPVLRNKAEVRADFVAIYGGVMFVGIFLTIVFLIATIMIIYYKQMSEGFEDRRRFTILKNVGLTEGEAKKTIKNQVMIIFFLPVVASIIHAIVASSIVRLFLNSILIVDGLTFGLSIAAACIVFFLAYTLVYAGTSKQYYDIVYGQSEAA